MDRQSIIIGAGLTAARAFAYLRTPVSVNEAFKPAGLSAAIPATVGGWTSRKGAGVVLSPQDDSNKLYVNVETRIYEGPDPACDNAVDRLQQHPAGPLSGAQAEGLLSCARPSNLA